VEVEPDTVEAVRDVHFDEVHWPVVGVCVHDGLEDPLECFAELHCLSGCHPDRLIIEAEERVIHNDSWTLRSLGYDIHRADAQVLDQTLVLLEQTEREDPEAFLDKVQKLLSKKVDVLDG
jgi:hypothetical protein